MKSTYPTRVVALLTMLLPGLVSPAGERTESEENSERVEAEWRRAYESRDWERAIDTGRQLVDLNPQQPGPAYNLACAYALFGDRDAAVHWLRVSAENGWSFTGTLLRDEDLDAIRDHPDYAAILDIIKKNNARELESFKKKAKSAKVLTFVPSNHDPTKPAPVIVAMHSYGGNAASFARVWRSLAEEADAILVVPQGLGRLGGGRFHWGKVEEGEFLVLRAIETAKKKYNVDGHGIILTGFSQGGSMAFLIALRRPKLISGVIPVAAYYDEDVSPIPVGPATPLPRFFILNGALDRDAINNRHAANLLKAAGAATRINIYEGVGHAFPPNRDDVLREALRFVLDR